MKQKSHFGEMTKGKPEDSELTEQIQSYYKKAFMYFIFNTVYSD